VHAEPIPDYADVEQMKDHMMIDGWELYRTMKHNGVYEMRVVHIHPVVAS
jgi:hypothetical protein